MTQIYINHIKALSHYYKREMNLRMALSKYDIFYFLADDGPMSKNLYEFKKHLTQRLHQALIVI